MKVFMCRPSVAGPLSPSSKKGPRRVAILALSMLLLGCGQKGPLTLPNATGAASAPAASK
ncbi:MAG TPA: lipoprotein [Burkholderiaceae bacterium]